MRTGISITLRPGDRRRLKALARDRNAPQKKHVWRARIVLLSADGVSTNETMRQTASRRPVSGAGRNASCRKDTAASCATRRDPRARPERRAHGLQPHRVQQFKLSNDRTFRLLSSEFSVLASLPAKITNSSSVISASDVHRGGGGALE